MKPWVELKVELRDVIAHAMPGPWFWTGYSAIMSVPRVKAYMKLEAALEKDKVPYDDPRWDAAEGLPPQQVYHLPKQGIDESHGGDARFDPDTRGNGRYAETAGPDVVARLLDRIDAYEAALQKIYELDSDNELWEASDIAEEVLRLP